MGLVGGSHHRLYPLVATGPAEDTGPIKIHQSAIWTSDEAAPSERTGGLDALNRTDSAVSATFTGRVTADYSCGRSTSTKLPAEPVIFSHSAWIVGSISDDVLLGGFSCAGLLRSYSWAPRASCPLTDADKPVLLGSGWQLLTAADCHRGAGRNARTSILRQPSSGCPISSRYDSYVLTESAR